MSPTIKPQQSSWLSLAKPRYWSSWLGISLLRAACYLPFQAQLRLGRLLGRTAQKLLKKRTSVARRNIALCFPDLSEKAQQRLLAEHFEAMGMGLFETAIAWWGDRREIDRLGQVAGLEHLEAAVKSGRGIMLITAHFSTMELCSALLNQSRQFSAMYRPMTNPLIDKVVLRSRQRKLKHLFPREDISSMIKGLRTGEIIWFGFDQDYGPRHSIYTDFFKVPAATITTTSRFARLGNALVVPYFPVRTKGNRYLVRILPALDNFPSDSIEQDNRRLNTMLESAIMEAPEQYFWIHRRFKTRLRGDEPLYE